jgi:transcriptional regulator with XRE-family HTH domain
MSTTQDLVHALRAELRAAGVTYADLAEALGLSESSVKRMFAKSDMPLSRIDEILRVLKIDFAELARKVVDARPLSQQLSVEQEAAVVADRRLLLVAICCLSQWSVAEIVRNYAIGDAECAAYLARLDGLGIIELRPLDRYRLKVAKGFRWLPHGPVMQYFREHVAADYLSGGFDGEGETILLVHGEITKGLAATLVERLQRVGQDFARAHLAEQALPDEQRTPYTLLVGMRSWLFAAFRDLKRDTPQP